MHIGIDVQNNFSTDDLNENTKKCTFFFKNLPNIKFSDLIDKLVIENKIGPVISSNDDLLTYINCKDI